MSNPPMMYGYPPTDGYPPTRGYPPPGANLTGSPQTGTNLSTSSIGASFLSVAIFFLIAFASNAILSSITLATLGITVTLSLLTFMAIIVFILFVL